MPTHDQVIDNGPGLAVRTDINAAFQALFSCSSSPAEPTVKVPGQLWFDTSDITKTALKIRSQANDAWIAVATSASSTITIAPAAGNSAELILNKPSGTAALANRLRGFTAGVERWSVVLGGNSSETGSNAGSDFSLNRFNDAGTIIDAPIVIGRANGKVTLPNSVSLGGAGYPAAGVTAENQPTTFTANFSTYGAIGMNAYARVGPPVAWASYGGGFGGYLSLDTSNGTISLLSSGASAAAGAVFASLPVRLQVAVAGHTYAGPRLLASDLMGSGSTSPVLGLYSQSLGSAMGWALNGANVMSLFNTDAVGVVSGSTYLNVLRSGISGVGPASDMSFNDNGAGSRVLSYSGNSYAFYTTASGTYTWVAGTVTTMGLPNNGNLDVVGAAPTKVGAGQWAARSDERIKQDIRDYDAGLDQILQIQPRVFQYRPETHCGVLGEDQIGLIAQEVEAIMPELVTVGPGAMGEILLEDMRVLDPTALTYALINAVKTLTARIATLEARP